MAGKYDEYGNKPSTSATVNDQMKAAWQKKLTREGKQSAPTMRALMQAWIEGRINIDKIYPQFVAHNFAKEVMPNPYVLTPKDFKLGKKPFYKNKNHVL